MIYYPKWHTWWSMKTRSAEGAIPISAQNLIYYVLDSSMLVPN